MKTIVDCSGMTLLQLVYKQRTIFCEVQNIIKIRYKAII